MEDVTEGCFPGWLHFFCSEDFKADCQSFLVDPPHSPHPFLKEFHHRLYLLAFLLTSLQEHLSFGLCDLLSVFLKQNRMANCLFSPVFPKGRETLAENAQRVGKPEGCEAFLFTSLQQGIFKLNQYY